MIEAEDGFHIAHVSQTGQKLAHTRYRFLISGEIVDPLPNDGEHLLYAPEPQSVYRLSIPALRAHAAQHVSADPDPQLKRANRVAHLEGDAVDWIADGNGAVRVAAAVHGGSSPSVRLWYRDDPDGDWRSLYQFSVDSLFELPLWPVSFAPDDRNFYVMSNRDRDTTALFEFDVEGAALGPVIFARDNADLDGVMLDYSGKRVLAAYYTEGGVRRYHHLEAFNARYQRSLEHAFPDESVAILNASRDDRYLVAFTTSPQNPGAYYLLNTEKNEAEPLGRVLPELGPEDLMEVKHVVVTTDDGVRLEGFLTLPKTQEKPPLVVMPHGGPIGVRDERAFDASSQYLAAQGFAVLQVNYRGSWGYGKAFLAAGMKQWGLGIEDDVDAVLDRVLQLDLVDADRMCIAGASYGGYSALMTAVRHPERFRCAASLAGVTDIPLMFNRSDLSTDDFWKRTFVNIAGDPEREFERMLERSPAYRAAEIQVPVFVAHGTWDRRVDIDHAFRLMAMLDLYRKPYEWMMIEEGRHSFTIEQARSYYRMLANFLWKHLQEPF
ncbi:MAG TPA: alpha/beta fold hydrolase [Myxococcota bacterium]